MQNEKIQTIEIEKTENNNTQLNIEPFIPNMINDALVHVLIRPNGKASGVNKFVIKVKNYLQDFGLKKIKLTLHMQYQDTKDKKWVTTSKDIYLDKSKDQPPVEVIVPGSRLQMVKEDSYEIRFQDDQKEDSTIPCPYRLWDRGINDTVFEFKAAYGENKADDGKMPICFYRRNRNFIHHPVKIIRTLEIGRNGKIESIIKRYTIPAHSNKVSVVETLNDARLGVSNHEAYYLQFPATFISSPKIAVEVDKLHPEELRSDTRVTVYRKPECPDIGLNITLHVSIPSGKILDDWDDHDIVFQLNPGQNSATKIFENAAAVVIREPKKYEISANPLKPYEINALVFSGGGARGIAYAGALKKLEADGVISYGGREPKIKCVVGASAGALIALACTLNYMGSDIYDLITQTNFVNLMDMKKLTFEQVKNVINDTTSHKWDAWTAYDLLNESRSVFGNESWIKFLRKVIERGDCHPDISFRELLNRRKVELHVVVCDVSRKQTVFCSPDNTPDLPVWKAVLASMSIPCLLPPVNLKPFSSEEPSSFIDGGLTNNYPLKYVMGLKDKNNKRKYNPLGLVLNSANGITYPSYKEVEEFKPFMGRLMDMALSTNYVDTFQSNDVDMNMDHMRRTIFITDIEKGPLDFDMNDKEKEKVISAGWCAVYHYFKKVSS